MNLQFMKSKKMQTNWQTKRLAKSPNAEVRELTLSLSLKFGSQAALDDLRGQLLD